MPLSVSCTDTEDIHEGVHEKHHGTEVWREKKGDF